MHNQRLACDLSNRSSSRSFPLLCARRRFVSLMESVHQAAPRCFSFVASRTLGDYTTRAILSTGSASQRECMHPNVSDPPYFLAHAKRTLRIPLRRNSQARICGRITTTRRFNAIGVSQKTRPLLLLSSRDITHHHSPSSPLLIPATKSFG